MDFKVSNYLNCLLQSQKTDGIQMRSLFISYCHKESNQWQLNLWRWKNWRVRWDGRCVLWKAGLHILFCEGHLLGWVVQKRINSLFWDFQWSSLLPFFIFSCLGASSLVGMWLDLLSEHRGNYQRLYSLLPVLCCGRLLRFLPSLFPYSLLLYPLGTNTCTESLFCG